jgi:hypothetical protein
MVPGQVITADTITYMRKLDVKEIHGYVAAQGIKLIKPRCWRSASRPSTALEDAHTARHTRSIRMQAFFTFLGAKPYILLFFTSAWRCGSASSRSRATASAWWPRRSWSGAAIATWASTYGVKLQLDNFAKSLMYYLFMYGVGLRVGPAFFNSLKKDGITFTILAVICSVLGLFLVVS